MSVAALVVLLALVAGRELVLLGVVGGDCYLVPHRQRPSFRKWAVRAWKLRAGRLVVRVWIG